VAPGAKAVVEEFLARQREMYAGGDLAAVEELLAEDVVWHVPGMSPIAGEYRGRAAVTEYFRLRRELAGGAIRITKEGEAHHEEALVQLADGQAPLGGREVVWRTAGAYRVAHGRIAEAWLVPLDQEQFDQVWAATRPAPFVSVQHVGPGDGARLVELLEAAFAECMGERLGADASLTVTAIDLRFLAPDRADGELRVEVALDRVTDHAVQAHFDVFAADARIAEAIARYVR
jgi:uncharacterized protein